MAKRFVFIVEVEIPDEEEEGFVYSFENKKFDFFRYLIDNDATITKKEEDDERRKRDD